MELNLLHKLQFTRSSYLFIHPFTYLLYSFFPRNSLSHQKADPTPSTEPTSLRPSRNFNLNRLDALRRPQWSIGWSRIVSSELGHPLPLLRLVLFNVNGTRAVPRYACPAMAVPMQAPLSRDSVLTRRPLTVELQSQIRSPTTLSHPHQRKTVCMRLQAVREDLHSTQCIDRSPAYPYR